MKQYLSPDQTAKLIELGLPKPKSEVKAEQGWYYAWYNPAYSIGELIEMLPPKVGEWTLSIERHWEIERWCVSYACDCFSMVAELIDALYDMIVKLKEDKIL